MSGGRTPSLQGRVMGLDYGSIRVGVALSDGLRLAAHAHGVLSAAAPDLGQRLAEIADEHDVTEVVIGLPTSLDGSEHASATGARRLAALVGSELDLPVHLYDERFTSKVAEQALLAADVSRNKRRQVIDKLAAAVMLQGFLDRSRADRSR